MRESHRKAEATPFESETTSELCDYDIALLRDDERVELQKLQAKDAYLDSALTTNAPSFRHLELESEQYYTRLRINELIAGYPQTGSVKSVTFSSAGGRKHNSAYRLERRNRYFGGLLNRLVNPIEMHELDGFGSGALTRRQLQYYMDEDPEFDRGTSPMVAGHVDRVTNEVVSYMLILRGPNPRGKTAFEIYMPKGALYNDGVYVASSARGQGLADELHDNLIDSAYRQGPIYWSVAAANHSMMSSLSRMGENHRDIKHTAGPYAGRCRGIELMYWDKYFGNAHKDGRVMGMYDLGLLIPDAAIKETPLIDPSNVENFIGRDHVAFSDYPEYDSSGVVTNALSIQNATMRLLGSGYIGIPLPKHRLYVHLDTLPESQSRIIQARQNELNDIRQKDMAMRTGSGVLRLLRLRR